MFRCVALILTAIVLVAAVAGAMVGWTMLPFALAPLILLFGLVFERYHYKPISRDPPGEGWDRTPEKFTDPRSGQPVIVYYNTKTGERRYVADQEV